MTRPPVSAGMLAGIAAQHGLHLEPELDESGNYTGRLALDLGQAANVTVWLIVDGSGPPG